MGFKYKPFPNGSFKRSPHLWHKFPHNSISLWGSTCSTAIVFSVLEHFQAGLRTITTWGKKCQYMIVYHSSTKLSVWVFLMDKGQLSILDHKKLVKFKMSSHNFSTIQSLINFLRARGISLPLWARVNFLAQIKDFSNLWLISLTAIYESSAIKSHGWRIRPKCILKDNRIKLVAWQNYIWFWASTKNPRLTPEADQAVVKSPVDDNLLLQGGVRSKCRSGLKSIMILDIFNTIH